MIAAREATSSVMKADPTFVTATRGFLEDWLIKKDYDTAFAYLSPKSYSCYDLTRSPDAPASTSPDDAGRKIRAALERSGGMTARAYITSTSNAITGDLFFSGLVKSPFLALAIGMIACAQGLAMRGGAAAVGTRTTTAVVLSIFGVIVINALFTLFFTLMGV